MTRIYNFRVLTVLMAAVLAALLTMLVAPSSQAAGKPDLVVPEANLTSRNYVFVGEVSKFSFTDTTKNRGSATAGSSKSALLLKQSLADDTVGSLVGAIRDVPKLKSGESDNGSGRANRTPKETRIGSYYAVVCADAKFLVDESKEGNNCHNTDKRLSIIPRSWTGSVTGSAPVVKGVTETWTAQQMTFKFKGPYEGLDFHYTAHGEVTYSVSGTDEFGCIWSGSGTALLVNKGGLDLSSGFSFYEGWADPIEPFYTITRTCPDSPDISFTGPWTSRWFDTGGLKNTTDRFGLTSLKGNYGFTESEGDVSYHWDLTAN
ncbi:MAG: CARDB domain-containing protein [Rubrobacteraceae bacterium]